MNLSQAINNIQSSIVQVRNSRGCLGTGFFVNTDGYIITAQHVIQGINQGLRVGLAYENSENVRGNFQLISFDIIGEDTVHDLALLKLMRNPFEGEVRSTINIKGNPLPLRYGTPKLNPNRPIDGAPVGISGYPLNENVLVTNGGTMATSWSTTIRMASIPEMPSGYDFEEIVDVYLADVEVNPGDSGAPVYLVDNATVIGLCRGSKTSPVMVID